MSAALAIDREAEQADVFLASYLAPFAQWLAREEITEIIVNRPGEVWIETAGAAGMARHPAPEINDRLMRRLAEQIARISSQGINRENPLLAATLPDGTRIQIVAPPATRGHWALAMRRHRVVDLPLEAWRPRAALGSPSPSIAVDRAADPLAWLSQAVRNRRTVLISGGTSSGKTTFLNALLGEIPRNERVIAVEDTPEIRLDAENALGLVAVRGELGEARVDTDSLLQASLRLRPDRIVLGELRGREAISFLRAINTGHPGSFSTIHANSCMGALDQLALLTMQAGLGLSRTDTLTYAASVIDLVVQLGRSGAERAIVDIRSTAELVGPK